jgi:atypical dual specificity phosphatase
MNLLWNFSWVKENEVAASSAPENSEHLQWLQSQGIKHVLCLDEDYMDVYKKPHHLNVKLIDIVEFEAPDSDTIESIVNYLRNVKERKEPVLIHCRAGWGRTGTILAIYLMEFYNKTAREAIQEVRNLRPWSIETTEQEDAVLNYESQNDCTNRDMYSVLFNDEEFYHPIADDPSIPTFLDPTYNPEYQSKGLESY